MVNVSAFLSLTCKAFLIIVCIITTVELMRKVATEEGIKWICTLLESEHALMVNDGLLALSLLATLRNGIIIVVQLFSPHSIV